MAQPESNKTTALFNNAANIYDKHNGDTTTAVARFMLSLPSSPTSISSPQTLSNTKAQTEYIILDNACGTGALTFELLHTISTSTMPNLTIHAVDISPAMISSLTTKLTALTLPSGVVKPCIGDAQNLPFEDSFFTHSYTNFGIFFLPDPTLGAAEIYRTLKPGGVAHISTWENLGYLELLQDSQRVVRAGIADNELFKPVYSMEWFTSEKLVETLVCGGFERENIEIYRTQTVLVGESVEGLVGTILLPFSARLEEDNWTEGERVRLKKVIMEGLSEEQTRDCRVAMDVFVAVAVK
ncbi:S-adenosyl-L-methionine-dependent methyltransferase [Aspergillus karnatakaensis]|uniref:class I SAM-dependent methyltransferase n=1 Tax=Aspergillus karnatakaensis TaxID=1810916 RepID=UPI003CCD1DD5